MKCRDFIGCWFWWFFCGQGVSVVHRHKPTRILHYHNQVLFHMWMVCLFFFGVDCYSYIRGSYSSMKCTSGEMEERGFFSPKSLKMDTAKDSSPKAQQMGFHLVRWNLWRGGRWVRHVQRTPSILRWYWNYANHHFVFELSTAVPDCTQDVLQLYCQHKVDARGNFVVWNFPLPSVLVWINNVVGIVIWVLW